MQDLIQSLMGELDGSPMNQLSAQLGADTGSTQTAVQAALPVLLGALAKNSASSTGANDLSGALDRDHDGSILDDLGGFLGNPSQVAGEGILRHVLGQKQPAVESGIGKATGMDTNQIAKLLPILAPIVMGYLGKQKRQQGLDASALASLLGTQQRQAQAQNPAFSVLSALLDRDDDGSVIDDLGSMLGGFLSGR